MRYLSLMAGMVLFLAGFSATAAQKRLAAGHVPIPVAVGKLAALGRLAATNELRLAIGLPLRDAAGLTNLVREIYNPASPQFHHYLTPKEFAERFGPTAAQYAAVVQFAETNGLTVSRRHGSRLVLDVRGRVGDVERAFQVRLHSYRHPTEKRNFFAPDTEPMVDATLPILQVSGLNNYSLPKPQVRVESRPGAKFTRPLAGSAPFGSYFGNDFRTAYVPGTTLTGTGQSVALLQFDGFFAVDITNFENAAGLTNAPPVVIEPVDGGVNFIGDAQDEVALDIEMVMSMAPGLSNIYVYEAEQDVSWLSMLSQMADDDLASQLSSSWATEGTDPASEQIFLQMAAQGQTFFNASGDSDAFTGEIGFPNESPNVTVVGGTMLTTDGTGHYLTESAWNRNEGHGTGGGISPNFRIPYWQLGLDLTAAEGSSEMRNIPDVALIAEDVFIYDGNGGTNFVGGTSCAAPLWAGYTALINQQAAQLGQPVVGFLNPAIYALSRGTNYGAAFHDITTGDNTSPSSPENFFAVPGFDLCTGWGTPNGTNFINVLTTPDYLGVSPTIITSSGLVGGLLMQTNWTLVLTNAGPADLPWQFGPLPSWLAVSATAGTLFPGTSTSVELELVPAAFPRSPMGVYITGLEITNRLIDRVETVAFVRSIGQSIVANGGFETGDFTSWFLDGDTIVGDLVYNTVTTDDFYLGVTDVVHSGEFGAFLGQGSRVADLYQALPTVVNQQYQFSFWLDNPVSGPGQQFTAVWGGSNLLNLVNPPAFGWTNFQYVVTASSTNTFLQFFEENDPGYFGFDDVSVTPVPPVVLGSVTPSGGSLQLNWDSLTGLNYQVQFTTNLPSAVWQNLGSVTAVTNVCSLSDTNIFNEGSQQFYRLELMP